MRTRSLRRVLAMEWALFALALCAALFGVALLLLFVLEDSFIDRRLREFAPAVHDPAQPPPLPRGFALHARERAPVELRERIALLAPGRIVEFRDANGRYLHVLHAQTADGAPFLLSVDVTDELSVPAVLRRASGYLLTLLGIAVLLAYAMGGLWVRRAARRAESLVRALRDADSPAALRAQAEREPVRELAGLGLLLAEAWEQRLDSMRRERETLAFLAHELRTPLQSARTSLATVRDGRADATVMARLERAVERLTRASNSVLWLASDADPGRHSAELAPLVEALIAAFAPLAQTRGQTLHADVPRGLAWGGPGEVLEAVLGNLLLNAIQHGGPGRIELVGSEDRLVVRNPAANVAGATPGFGVGLQLSERLCARCGWQLQRHETAASTEHRIVAAPVVDARRA